MSEEEFNNLPQEEQEKIIDEDWQATLEDHDLDDASLKRKKLIDPEPMTKEYSELVSSGAKTAYKKLYDFGFKKDGVRRKLEHLSVFLGNVGSISDLNLEQWRQINWLLDNLKNTDYKF